MITEKDLPVLGATYKYKNTTIVVKHIMAYQLPNGYEDPVNRILISEDNVNCFVFDKNKWEIIK